MIKCKIKPVFLFLSVLVLAAGLFCCLHFTVKKPVDDYDLYYNSAVRMQGVLSSVADYCDSEGILLEPEDINSTYLIGPCYTELTSTMGYEDIKRTGLNPNNAAVMVKLFKEKGLVSGDTVAIGTSGSFPGWAIAAVCAATELGLDVKVIASYGSSMYGSTRPTLSIVKILQIAQESGFASFDFIAVSPGGENDRGVGAFEDFLFENTRSLVLDLAYSSGLDVIDTENVSLSVAKRKSLFGDIDCFVNVGGAIANTKLCSVYEEEGVPVIEILNIKNLALENGLPFDPVPLPSAGEGGIYYTTSYNLLIILLTLILAFAILFLGL